MKNKIVKSTLVVALVAFCGYGTYERYVANENCNSMILAENVEAMSAQETGGIEMAYCWEKSGTSGATRTICASGTTTTLPAPSYPMGTIYNCSGTATKGAFASRIGYCYNKVR